MAYPTSDSCGTGAGLHTPTHADWGHWPHGNVTLGLDSYLDFPLAFLWINPGLS